MRDGIKAILEHSDDYLVVAEASEGAEALRICRQNVPAVVIMDLNMPGGLGGIDTTVQLLREHPNLKIVVLSMNDDEASVMTALRAGARGFVLKTASDNDLLSALRTIAQGGTYLSPAVSSRVLSRLQSRRVKEVDAADPLDKLSPREKQVLQLVAQGKSSREIALILGVEPHTVHNHRKVLMRKFGVTNVAGLPLVAIRSGLVHSEGALPFTRGYADSDE